MGLDQFLDAALVYICDCSLLRLLCRTIGLKPVEVRRIDVAGVVWIWEGVHEVWSLPVEQAVWCGDRLSVGEESINAGCFPERGLPEFFTSCDVPVSEFKEDLAVSRIAFEHDFLGATVEP